MTRAGLDQLDQWKDVVADERTAFERMLKRYDVIAGGTDES